MNTAEQQLSEMLHRITPEPPRQVTVQDVAARLARDGGPGRYHGGPAGWPRGRYRRWAPALAAASVIVVAAASAGLATALTSHRGPATAGGQHLSSSSPPSLPAPVPPIVSASPMPPLSVAGGVWGAELINRQSFQPFSLAAGSESLYAFSASYLVRINPGTGQVTAMAPYHPPVPNPPVFAGSTVWVVASYSGSSVVLRGYDSRTLAQVASVTVPVSGQVSSRPQGVLTLGPDGDLYLAAGNGVAVINPQTRQVDRRISMPAGPVASVAVSPDGSRLYVSTGSLQLLTYNPATGAQLASSAIPDLTSTAGNLVATSGGVWGTAGVGMSEWVWFAKDADLTRMVRVGQGTGAGLSSLPTYSGGVIWIGGSHTLVCADPATGQTRASTTIPTDKGVVEYFSGVAVVGGHAYSLYLNQAARQAGLARLTPPAACGG